MTFEGLRSDYKIIYADPPWTFKAYSEKGEGKSASQHYQTMTILDILRLPVSNITANDAALFLWVTQPMLPQGLKVMEAWGFEFKTVAFCWIKMRTQWRPRLVYDTRDLVNAEDDLQPRLGMGYHTRSGMEQCWLGTKGKGYARVSSSVQQVLHSPLREHSRKPDEVANRIEDLVGKVPKIELFARAKRPGWDVWGLESNKFEVTA